MVTMLSLYLTMMFLYYNRLFYGEFFSRVRVARETLPYFVPSPLISFVISTRKRTLLHVDSAFYYSWHLKWLGFWVQLAIYVKRLRTNPSLIFWFDSGLNEINALQLKQSSNCLIACSFKTKWLKTSKFTVLMSASVQMHSWW